MNEQGGFIVSIKTWERIDFDRLLSGRYNIDVFQHSATFDEEKKQFIVDALLNLELIGQLVRDGYVVEVKAYHLAQGLPASQIMNVSEWLKEVMEKDKAEKAKEAKATKAKAKKAKHKMRPESDYVGGESLPKKEYLDYDGVWTVLNFIHNRFPRTTALLGLEGSHERRVAPIFKISGRNRVYGILLVGGLHARELINPDILISLAGDLCYTYASGRNLRYGQIVFPNKTIRQTMDMLDIYIMPLANPDGRVYAMNSQDLWRMNRNPNGGRTCSVTCPDGVRLDGKGVDCNRNFDFLWNSGIMTSTDPCHCSQTYKGSSPFSEPDSRNIRTLLDNNPRITWMVDLHSYAEKILYPWQIDENQTTDINMNFRNAAYNGQRGRPNDAYKEYIRQNDLSMHILLAGKMRDTINRAHGRNYYTAGQGASTIYPASATSTDYAYSRHFVDNTKTRVYAWAIETAKAFNPVVPENGAPAADDEKWLITKEISAGLVEFLKNAAFMG